MTIADQARWTVDKDGYIVCVFPTGDGVDVRELYHPATPYNLAVTAKALLATLVRDRAAVTQERDALRAVVARLLDNWEPDTYAESWQQVTYSHIGNPPERAVDRMTEPEMTAIAAARAALGDTP